MKSIKLSDKHYFETINGIWTGKSQERLSFPVLRNTNFRNDGNLNYDDVAQIDVDKSEVRKKSLSENDILLEKSGGGPNTPVGRVVLYKGDSNKYLFSNFCSRIRVINNELLPEFVFLYLFGIHITGKTEKLQSNTTNLRNLIGRKYFALDIPLLSKTEQKSFVENIQAQLACVETMRREGLKQRESVKALQPAILREVFPMRPPQPEESIIRYAKISDLAVVNPSRKKMSREPFELTPFVPMECVDENKGVIEKVYEKPFEKIAKGYTYFENGDIIFAKITPCMENGKSAIVENLKSGIGFGSTEFIVIRPKKEVYRKWLYQFVRSKDFRDAAKAHFTGSAGQQRVPVPFVNNALIPMPDEEDEIEGIISEVEQELAQIEIVQQAVLKQLNAIEALPAAILREAFILKTKEY